MLTALIGSADPNIGASYTLDCHRIGRSWRRQPLPVGAAGSRRSGDRCDRYLLAAKRADRLQCLNLRPSNRIWRDPGCRRRADRFRKRAPRGARPIVAANS